MRGSYEPATHITVHSGSISQIPLGNAVEPVKYGLDKTGFLQHNKLVSRSSKGSAP
jgi:hypothetical protein